MYQNYIFDLYGTLIDIRTDESPDSFWKQVADIYLNNGAYYDSQELKHSYLKYAKRESQLTHILHPFYKKIDIKLEKIFSKLYKDKGVAVSDKIIAETALLFRKASTKFICLYDGVIDLLESLKQAGKKIYLLSNAQYCFTYPELVELNIDSYFDGIMISSDENCAKPDTAFFNKLLKRYKLKKSDSIMIGNDVTSDILGAHNAGLDSLYIHQEISSPLEGRTLYSKWSIMDGDVYKIKDLILAKE